MALLLHTHDGNDVHGSANDEDCGCFHDPRVECWRCLNEDFAGAGLAWRVAMLQIHSHQVARL